MIKIKILGEYNCSSDVKDDYYADEEKQIETVNKNNETVLKTVVAPKLIKGDYVEIDEADFALIGKTKKFSGNSVIDMTAIEIADFEAKRNMAKAQAQKQAQITALKKQLVPLQEDLVQIMAGQYIPNIEYKRAEFRRIHNEIRALEGKPQRGVQNG